MQSQLVFIVAGSAILLSVILTIIQRRRERISYLPIKIVFGIMIVAVLAIPISIFLIWGWTGLGVSALAVYVLLFCISFLISSYAINLFFKF
ncbi:hypothetical protein LCM10_01865 [Rossellomorea aquimaris]|uniref:hypothetical protein n=1 Tax=Rossellomorea aquimaris TaxID=189382 RepID=UPI001CD78A57|nr:hypothetical protein [Rossellomorea aquimaris]MCA1053717.1 hypothetical protein [Rossellomorea aquimaris]